MTAAHTPTGSRRIIDVKPVMYSPAAVPSSTRAAPAKKRIWSHIGGISSSIVSCFGLPVLRRLDVHELLGALLERVGDPQQGALALGRRGVAPALERARRVLEGGVDVGLARQRRGGVDLAGAGIDQLGRLAARRGHALAVDEVRDLFAHGVSSV